MCWEGNTISYIATVLEVFWWYVVYGVVVLE
jgi:hypothetical protein